MHNAVAVVMSALVALTVLAAGMGALQRDEQAVATAPDAVLPEIADGPVASDTAIPDTAGGQSSTGPAPFEATELPAAVATMRAAQSDAPSEPRPSATPASPKVDHAPAIEVVRVDGSGSAVIAGRAPPDSEVTLRVDGEKIASARTDGAGNFVSLFRLRATDLPRVLTADIADATGKVDEAVDEILIAPPAAVGPEFDVASAAPATMEVPEPSPGAVSGTASRPAEPRADRTDPPGAPPSLPLAKPEIRAATRAPARPPSEIAGPEGEAATRAPAPEADAPRLFRTGPDGLRLLAGEAPKPLAPAGLRIDAITYDTAGDAQLAGRGPPDAPLRIYLDNRAVQTVRVAADGTWAAPLRDVEVGVYALRIDAQDETGGVASRIETPFERAAPQEAVAILGDEDTAAVTVQPGSTLWAISEGYFGEGIRYVQIFEANRELIGDPDLIYPGQVFALPAQDVASDPG